MSSLKLFVLVVLLVLVLTFNSACTSQGLVEIEESSPAHTPVYNIPSATTDEPAVTIHFACPAQGQAEFERLAVDFHAQTPSIQIEIATVEEILTDNVEDITQKLASAADTAYFLVDLDAALQGLLRDLSPFIKADPTFEPEDFFPGMLEAFEAKGGTWALPSQAWISVLYYDRQMFDRAGVSYPTLNWTREDFLTAAQQLTLRQGQEVTQYGFVDYGADAADVFLHRLAGGPTGSLHPLDTPVLVDAVGWYTDLVLRYQVMPEFRWTQESFDLAYNLIAEAKAAMWSSRLVPDLGLCWPSRNATRDVGVALFPTEDGPVASADMYGYMMSAGTEHPQESWRWLHFLSRQQLLDPLSTLAKDLPPRRSVAERNGYWNQFDEETIEVARYAAEHLLSLTSAASEKRSQLNAAVDAVFDGEPVEEALAEAQAAFEEWLAQMEGTGPAVVTIATPRPESAEAPTVVFAPPPDADMAAYRALADAFNQTHTDAQVQIVTPNQVERADCFAGLRSADDASTRASLLNLQPLLQSDPSFALEDWHPRFLDALRFRGDLWGLPTQAQVRVLFYNHDLFDAAGVPYPEPGWTLDDFLERAVDLTQGSGDEKVYGFLPLNGDTSDLLTFFALQGASPWDERDQPQLDAPEVVAAMRWYADLALDYGVMPAFPDDLLVRSSTAQETRYALVREGKAAMWTDFTGIDRGDVWPVEAEVGIAPLPVGTEKVTQFLYEGMFIAADTPHPEACWEWLKFASAQTTLLRGVPARRSLLESADFAEQVGEEALESYRASLEYADVGIPASPEASAQFNWLLQALAEVLTGARPEVALTEAQRKATE